MVRFQDAFQSCIGDALREMLAREGRIDQAVDDNVRNIQTLGTQWVHGPGKSQKSAIDLDAMFIWSTMHELASIIQSNAMNNLDISKIVSSKAIPHAMEMIGYAMHGQDLNVEQ